MRKRNLLYLENQVLQSLKILAVNLWKSPHGIWRRTAAQNLELDFHLGKRAEEVWAWISEWKSSWPHARCTESAAALVSGKLSRDPCSAQQHWLPLPFSHPVLLLQTTTTAWQLNPQYMTKEDVLAFIQYRIKLLAWSRNFKFVSD